MKAETDMYILSVFCIGLSVSWYAIYAGQLLRQTKRSRLQLLLGIIFLWYCLSTMKDLAIYIPGVDAGEMLRHIMYVDGCGALTFALPLMELTMPGWITTRRVLVMSLPFMLFLLAHLMVHDAWLDIAYTIFFVGFALSAVGVAIVKGRQYAKTIRETYSDLTRVDISWVWKVLIMFTACQLVWWGVSQHNDVFADTIYYVFSLVCWYVTMNSINRMQPIRLNESLAKAEPVSAARNYTSVLDGRLEQLMDEQQLYLNPELTLSDLVTALGTNRTYLSDYISNTLNTTFYDYVNQLRIERKAVPMIKATDRSYTFEYIAEQSGFNSITTFRRAFKKFTGKLPSEFMPTK